MKYYAGDRNKDLKHRLLDLKDVVVVFFILFIRVITDVKQF